MFRGRNKSVLNMEIKKDILDILAQYIDVPIEDVKTNEGVKYATGLDSFRLFSFIGELEEHFGLTFEEKSLKELKTLDDLIAYISQKKG